MKRLEGLVAAAYTPMHGDGGVNPERIAPLVEYALEKRFAALFAVGSTGEFPSLTVAERKLVAEHYIRAAAGRIPVIVNVASCCYADAAELAGHAAGLGADALCVMTPFYFKPETPRDLADFVKKIVPGCDGRPLFFYYAPSMTGLTVDIVEFLKIMVEEVPNFAGMKYTNENLFEMQRCIDLAPGLQIMAGRDEMLLGALAMGATAAVGTTFNYLPKVYHGVVDAFRRGDLERARLFMNLSHRASMISRAWGLSSIKVFMKFAGLDVGPMRLPARPLSAAEEAAFRRELSRAGLDEYIG